MLALPHAQLILNAIMRLRLSHDRKWRSVNWLVLGLIFLAFGSSTASGQSPIEAVTSPSKDVTMSFTRPGQVAEVLVKDGDRIEATQVLVSLNDRVEQSALAKLKAESEDTTEIEAAQAQLAQSRVDLEKMEWAHERGAATALEIEHAKTQVLIDELRAQLRRFELEQVGRDYARATLELDRMSLTSSIDGVVERVHVEVGESVNAMDEVVRLVSIDPLWIDVPAPLAEALGLELGYSATVSFLIDDPDDPVRTVTGKVIHIASVADAASGTLIVRVESPNPLALPAGQRALVSFPPAPQGDAAGDDLPSSETVPTVLTEGDESPTETNMPTGTPPADQDRRSAGDVSHPQTERE